MLFKAVVCVTWSLSDCCLALFGKTNHEETNSWLDTFNRAKVLDTFVSRVELVENRVLMVTGA